MPNPILKSPQLLTSNVNALNATTSSQNRTSATLINNPTLVKQILRKRRSKQYLDAIQKLDAGGTLPNPKLAKEILQVIKNEFPDIAIENILLGCMAICHLGNPLEVHTIEANNPVIVHVPHNYPMGTAMEKARSLSLMTDYICVEIYSNELRAISTNGIVSVIDAPTAEDDWSQYQSQPTIYRAGCGERFV